MYVCKITKIEKNDQLENYTFNACLATGEGTTGTIFRVPDKN